ISITRTVSTEEVLSPTQPSMVLAYKTTVTLTVKNTRSSLINEVLLTDISPSPEAVHDESSALVVKNLAPREQKSVSYSFTSFQNPASENVLVFSEPSHFVSPIKIQINAPARASTGESVKISIKSTSGTSVVGVQVRILTPSIPITAKTDSGGAVYFTPSEEGIYSIEVPDFYVENAPSFEVSPSLPSLNTEAALAGSSLFEFSGNSVPLLGISFVILILIGAAMLYFAQEPYEPETLSPASPKPREPKKPAPLQLKVMDKMKIKMKGWKEERKTEKKTEGKKRKRSAS
ncbi:MAG: hypothetical protein ABIH99_01120, partial [Candidatus Micrarchaeota archaeon]